MLVIHDPRCSEFGSSMRPEQPSRVVKTSEYLRASLPGLVWEKPDNDVADDVLLLAHTAGHLRRLSKPADFDPDTPFFPGIATHARRGVAAALKASGHALATGEPAFSLMRPPGHHATTDQAMGFCYLNSIAVAVLSARALSGAARVAVWDFDAHHGNGTEDILLGREGVLFSSVHQSPCYPGTGLQSQGNCRNRTVPPGAPRPLHMRALRESLDEIVEFKPDLVLVSAGFDAYAGDPITEMTLEGEDFGILGKWLRESGLPSAAVLEGGYSADLPRLVEAFLSAWAP